MIRLRCMALLFQTSSRQYAFVNKVVGTMGLYTTEVIEDYL
jgi:hypothetical protein